MTASINIKTDNNKVVAGVKLVLRLKILAKSKDSTSFVLVSKAQKTSKLSKI